MTINDTMETALQLDASNRARALSIESFIVEAPAGAGKTELLTQRFLKLLQTVQAPEEIIAITFTNKAASEMRARILESLQLAATGQLPLAAHKQITFHLGQAALNRSAALGWHLLDTPARLRIYTIDALCANLARQMPLLSRFGSQPAVTEDVWSYYREAAQGAIQSMDDAELGAPVRQVLRYLDNDQAKLEGLLVAMLAKREQWLHLGHAEEQANTRLAWQYLIESELAQVCEVLPPRIQHACMPIARYAASQLETNHPLAPLLDWQQPLTASLQDLDRWQALAELLLTNAGELRKKVDKQLGLAATQEAKPHKEALMALLDELRLEASAARLIARIQRLPTSSQQEDSIIAALRQLLTLAAAQLWVCFQATHAVDFVEIAQRALQALVEGGEATELAMRLDYKIQHILVDEFQDTSPMQIDLLKALTRGWQAGDGRTLFAVGDPMQSIYRFRKANVGLFLTATVQGIGDIPLTPLKLWRNNRSSPAVVEWINHTFAAMFPAQDAPSQGAIRYRPFVATRSDMADAGVTIHPLMATESEAEDSARLRQHEAEHIIRIIQQTRASHPHARIAVLVRARRHLHALVSEMRRNHRALSFQAVEIEELANRQIVQDLLTLTHALHQRADRVHWLALLRAPWCGLTLADLHALIGQDGHSTVLRLLHTPAVLARLSADGQQRALHVRDTMQSALAGRGRTTVSRWIHNTWLRLGGAQCLWDANDVEDVQAFFERVTVLEQSGQFHPQALAEDVKKLYAAANAKADPNLQFMTIHKSKGLEFDTVILPGLDGGNPADEAKLVIWEEVAMPDGDTALIAAPFVPTARKRTLTSASPYDYLNALDRSRAAYEDARVLYVAATRAERHLHLLGVAKRDKTGTPQPKAHSFLALLWPAVSQHFNEDENVAARFPNTQAQSPMDQFIPQLIRLVALPSVSDLPAATLAAEAPSFTHQSNETQPSLEAAIGTLTHRYLQWIAEQGLAAWQPHLQAAFVPLQAAMQRWFKQQGHTGDAAIQGAHRVKQLLTTTLHSAEARWVLQAHTQAAAELAIDQADDRTNIIDRTFIAEGIRWIIDYKSTPVQPQDDLAAIALSFKPQLTAYARLFQAEALPIKAAILLLSIGKLVHVAID